jgi:4-amino-4-deoxy-L-arabinose transferase-like glycosyltransferase
MKRQWFLVAVLLALHALLLWHSASQKSPTVDEGSHLAAGLYSLTTLDFRVNRETPPFQNLLCAIPVAICYDYQLDFNTQNWKHGIWNGGGSKLLKANPDIFHAMIQTGRLGTMLISVLLCFVIYRWAFELWGNPSALLVLLLTVFEPNLLAHGRLITTDTAATFWFVLTGYFFWRFTKKANWNRLWLIGLSFGGCWYTKHSGFVLIFALCIAFFLIDRYTGSLASFRLFARKDRLPSLKHQIGRAFVFTLICLLFALCVIWIGYGFEVGDSIDENIMPYQSTLWLYCRDFVQPLLFFFGLEEWFLISPDTHDDLLPILRRSIPAYSHWCGFAKNQLHLKGGHLSYYMNQLSWKGWKSYYPVLFLVKTPLGLLLILCAGTGLLICRKLYVDRSALTSLLAIPSVYGLVLILFSTANIGYRHALPLLPFMLILFAGGCFSFFLQNTITWKNTVLSKRVLSLCFCLLLVTNTVNVLVIHPHYLSYFSSLIGGWKNGRLIAVDSNLDWGQDLLYLQPFMEERGLPFVHLAYFGPTDYPSYYGIPHVDAMKQDKRVPGDYVVSVSVLQGLCRVDLEGTFQELRKKEPDAYITPSLYYYYVE